MEKERVCVSELRGVDVREERPLRATADQNRECLYLGSRNEGDLQGLRYS